jgi:MFS transporter, DHA1 family, solute carrier family 18 (vesicular amine transporter), member 1/2
MRSSRTAAVALVTFATFTDIIAYSIAVPVLPDLTRRLGASPTMMGLLFASFGVSVLALSLPMGALSDRMGRKTPLVLGLFALAASTVMFAFAERLPSLFAARLVQGAADAVTWVVGFALLADLYGPAERGRIMGFVMSGTTFGFVVGPTAGGWLYEKGGTEVPFLCVAACAVLAAIGFLWLKIPSKHTDHVPVPISAILRVPAVAVCSASVVVIGGTIAMVEPILSLFLASEIHLRPSRVGLVFGCAAVASAVMHPVAGLLADRWGARRVTIIGLIATGCALPLLGLITSFSTAVAFFVLNTLAVAIVITPSLAYMAEATSTTGVGSFGVAFGLYNFAWAIGLLVGPATGGFLYERIGFARLVLAWAPIALTMTFLIIAAEKRPARVPARENGGQGENGDGGDGGNG